MPYVNYADAVGNFRSDLYEFIEEHKELELNRYKEILERSGIQWGSDSMAEADPAALDARAILALLVGAVRADRFSEGALFGFLENGSIGRWLERLKAMDEES